MSGRPPSPPASDPYAALAPLYDAWQECFGSFWRLTLPRLEEAFESLPATAEPPSYLDLACGTGSLLLGLRAQHPGWRLAGLDASACMLAEAQAKPHANSITWLHAPFEDAPTLGTFSVVGCFYDAFNHLPDVEALGRAFAAAAAALRPGGLLVFDVNNRQGYEAWWRHRERFAGPGWELVVATTFDRDANTAHGHARVRWHADARPAAEINLTERCFAPEELAACLDEAGFALTSATPWPLGPGQVAGKTWFVARKR